MGAPPASLRQDTPAGHAVQSSIVAEAPEAPAALAFVEVAGRVAAQISISNMRVLRVIQTA